MREKFVFYEKYLKGLNGLDEETKGLATLAIVQYALYQEMPDNLTDVAMGMFELIRTQLDRSLSNSRAGSKSVSVRKKKQKEAYEEDSSIKEVPPAIISAEANAPQATEQAVQATSEPKDVPDTDAEQMESENAEDRAGSQTSEMDDQTADEAEEADDQFTEEVEEPPADIAEEADDQPTDEAEEADDQLAEEAPQASTKTVSQTQEEVVDEMQERRKLVHAYLQEIKKDPARGLSRMDVDAETDKYMDAHQLPKDWISKKTGRPIDWQRGLRNQVGLTGHKSHRKT